MTLSTIGSGPGEFLEIWRFGIQSHPPENGKSSMYTINGAMLSAEMSDLLRSIEHSCSFLVGIPPNCKFDIDVCCDSSASASEFWTHATGNLLGVEKISGRTIKVRWLALAALHSPLTSHVVLFLQLDTCVDIAAHAVGCSLVMNTLEHMASSTGHNNRDSIGA
jgi:hypothetical protein